MSTPSLKSIPAVVPGHCAAVCAGTWLRLTGNVTGSLPDGSTVPKISAAIAAPVSCPPYQFSNTPATELSHGMTTGPPLLITTIVCGLAAATSAIIVSSVARKVDRWSGRSPRPPGG